VRRAAVKRTLVLGRGGAGKSTFARRLGALTGLPVIELDQLFWQPGLVATPRDRWVDVQHELIQGEAWVIDGDLGPYDVLEPRLAAADTVLILDFSLPRCAWRSIRRSSERIDFWRWVIGYRRQSLPVVLAMIAEHAPHAGVHRLRTPRAADAFLELSAGGRS
jgi:adenylate kinase family enzyme